MSETQFLSKANNTVVLKKASLEDTDLLIPFFDQNKSKVIERLKGEFNFTLIASVKNNPIGLLDFCQNIQEMTQHTGIFKLAITSNFQGQGIGEQLLFKLIDWASGTNKIEIIAGSVLSNNISAINLLRKFSFDEDGRKKNWIRLAANQYLDEIIMSKHLLH